MAVAAKICGVTTVEALEAALAGGAAFVGFNFFPKSPRYLAPEAAARLAERARARAKIVAVMVDPSDEDADRISGALRPDFAQLHGAETPSRARAVAQRMNTSLIKVLPVAEAHDVAAAADFDAFADHLMFDTKAAPNADLPGGTGRAFDWTLLCGRRFRRPWFLAGGLDPWNVTEAVQRSGAPFVDVSSGVERGPGLKDPALIAAFLDAAKRA